MIGSDCRARSTSSRRPNLVIVVWKGCGLPSSLRAITSPSRITSLGGKIDKVAVKEFPFAVDEAVVNRGQDRYDIYCSPCHDKTGGGNGMVIQRGFKRQPPSYHIDRLRQADVGYFFDVITNGFGAMPDYKAQIAPRDRATESRDSRRRGRRSLEEGAET